MIDQVQKEPIKDLKQIFREKCGCKLIWCEKLMYLVASMI